MTDLEQLQMLDADEVCALLKVKKDWLYDVCQAGTFPHVKFGRQLRFRAVEIAAYIEEQAAKAGSPKKQDSPPKPRRRVRTRGAVA